MVIGLSLIIRVVTYRMTSQRDTQPTQRKMITKRRPTAITCDSVGKKDDKASLPLLVGSKKVNCSIFRFVRRPIEVGMVPSSLFCRPKSNFVSRVRFLRVDVPNNRLSRMLSSTIRNVQDPSASGMGPVNRLEYSTSDCSFPQPAPPSVRERPGKLGISNQNTLPVDGSVDKGSLGGPLEQRILNTKIVQRRPHAVFEPPTRRLPPNGQKVKPCQTSQFGWEYPIVGLQLQ